MILCSLIFFSHRFDVSRVHGHGHPWASGLCTLFCPLLNKDVSPACQKLKGKVSMLIFFVIPHAPHTDYAIPASGINLLQSSSRNILNYLYPLSKGNTNLGSDPTLYQFLIPDRHGRAEFQRLVSPFKLLGFPFSCVWSWLLNCGLTVGCVSLTEYLS